jgi:eukaryotic-like serine/threonine-protein kinase
MERCENRHAGLLFFKPSSYSDGVIRFLRLLAKLLVLVIVALAAALLSMRFAIHGREVTTPDLRGMTAAEAERNAAAHGLEFSLSDRFYSSTVPAGHIVSQRPEPGTRVRRGWRLQAAESLGPQLIEIPSLIGMSPRAAEIEIGRRALEPGDAAELPIDGFPPQTVLAQTPAPGAKGVAAPRISLLYAVPEPEIAYVVPELSGLSVADATEVIRSAAGMKAAIVGNTSRDPHSLTVIGQSPAAGSRISPGETISLQAASSL